MFDVRYMMFDVSSETLPWLRLTNNSSWVDSRPVRKFATYWRA